MKKSGLYKGSLQTIILKLLNDNGRMYGYEITQKVKQLSSEDLEITEGALYPTLHKLEGLGHLEVEMERVDGRMRKYYKLTESGEKETVNKLNELDSFLQTMNLLLQPKLG